MDKRFNQTSHQRRQMNGQRASTRNAHRGQGNAEQTTMRCRFAHARRTVTRKRGSITCRHGQGEARTCTRCWWACKMVQPLWKQFDSFLKKNWTWIYCRASSSMRNESAGPRRDLYVNVQSSIVQSKQTVELEKEEIRCAAHPRSGTAFSNNKGSRTQKTAYQKILFILCPEKAGL